MRGRTLMVWAFLGMWTALCATSRGATVGLWLFDNLTDDTPPAGMPPVDPPGGDRTTDSSGNGFDFVAAQNGGTVALSADRPAVIPSGTSLDSNAGGAALFSTPASDRFSVGKTGQLTVEYWFKHVTGGSFPYTLSFNGGNGGAAAQDWGIYANEGAGTLNFFAYPNTGFPEAGWGTSPLDGNWHHLAATAKAGDLLRVYRDGVQVGTAAAGTYTSATDVLKFARDTTDAQANIHFLIDELRISDVALLPGNGSGNGVLAWNASLVPEPGSLSLIAIASGLLLRRGRRRA